MLLESRRRPARSLSGLAGLALVVSLTGCASSGSSDDADGPGTGGTSSPSAGAGGGAAVDLEVLRAELAAQYAGDRPQPSDLEEAGCFADALLERRDAEALADAGVVDADGHLTSPFPVLDVDTAEAWVDAQAECIDFVTASSAAFAAQSRGRLDQEAYAQCLSGRIGPDRVREALVASLSGGLASPAVADLTAAQSTCASEALPQD